MIYGSVCSGVEAATTAWHQLGWRPAFFSEIEPFPSAVLAHRYPQTQNLGDMTKFKEWPDATLDLLVGGTPCQSFSVAGLRKGLDDPRGSLMLTYLAIARRYRPRWLVWENVPGVLSADKGRAFGTLLGGMAELGYGFAYRVLDAQYVRTLGFPFAVPQRRRRVFVVGYLGDWRRAAAVLFDVESLSGNPPPIRKSLGLVAANSRRSPEVNVLTFDRLSSRGYGVSPVASTISARDFKSATDLVLIGGRLRRLTIRECERLQGFPDDFTDIPWRGRMHSPDGPRYKAIGNSMAVNVMQWIGERIQNIESIHGGVVL